MKKLNYLIILVLLISISCQDVLDEKIVSGVTSEYLSTPEGFQAGINASYAKLRTYYGRDVSANLTAFGVDEYTNGPHGADHHLNKYEAQLNADDRSIWTLWSNFYEGINYCNAVINRGKEVNLPETKRNDGIAQTRFLRAFFYFTLVEQFGPIHLTLEETVGVETEANRTSEDIVYEAIIDDLEFAIEHLPAIQPEFGRATEPAAKNMLALVLLTRGYKDFAHSEDFNRAAVLATEVINDYHHVLLDDIEKSYSQDDEQNAEIIWSVQYTTDKLLNGSGNDMPRFFRPRYYAVPGLIRDMQYGRPAIRAKPTHWLLSNFRPLDVDSRYEKSFYHVWRFNSEPNLPEGASVGDTAIWITDEYLTQADYDAHKARLHPEALVMSWHPDNYYNDDPWNMYTSGENMIWPNPTKWDDLKRSHFNAVDGNRDVIVYKLSETYLIAAEAMYMRDGNGNAAVEYINAIRRRAAWPGKESEMEVSAADIDIDFILDERSRELFGEMKRWNDLKRTGKLLERVKKYNPDAAPNIKEFHLLRPIPTNQIVRTIGDYAQNPGY